MNQSIRIMNGEKVFAHEKQKTTLSLTREILFFSQYVNYE
jgi:hypothetical protein